jgi:hypothetical protein
MSTEKKNQGKTILLQTLFKNNLKQTEINQVIEWLGRILRVNIFQIKKIKTMLIHTRIMNKTDIEVYFLFIKI